MRNLFKILLCCVLVLLASYAGYRGYKARKIKHLMSLAHGFLAKSDLRNAVLSVQEVLGSAPNNLDATRMMAQLTEASSSPSALIWRSRVVELSPHSVEDRLALAQTALTMKDYASATNALEGVDIAGKKTAAYHNLAGAVAAAVNKPAEAEMHFLEASRLEPQNPAPQLNLAVVRLHGTNTPELKEARSVLRGLASNSTNSDLRCQALRELTMDAIANKQEATALAFSKQLIQETNSAFKDRLLRLDVLRVTRNADFKPALANCQRDAATNQSKIFELATWEMARTSPADTLAWLRGLPMNTQTNQPATLVVADCYAALKDWRGLQAWVEKQRWAELEFMRRALLSQALRGQQLADAAKTEWEQALKSANDRKQSLVMLLRMAERLKWVNEGEDLLWTIVNRYPEEKWAAQALTQELYSDGRTRSLMQLFSQELKRSPSDLTAKNDLAMTAMLLDAKELKPYNLAREVHQQAPTNSFYAATYAFSLYLQGKSGEALKVMQQLPPKDLEDPATAGYYGLILKAAGSNAKARVYLDWTSKATSLLPEERQLFAQAKAGT